eukprot:6210972-Pleurochrysis_carterae.AAC.7
MSTGRDLACGVDVHDCNKFNIADADAASSHEACFVARQRAHRLHELVVARRAQQHGVRALAGGGAGVRAAAGVAFTVKGLDILGQGQVQIYFLASASQDTEALRARFQYPILYSAVAHIKGGA